MHLVQLDSDNVVLSVTAVAMSLLLTPLSDRHMIAVNPPTVGQVFDPETKTFVVPPRNRWVTKLAFWNRMTQAERIGVDLASERPVQGAEETEAAFATRRSNAAALRDMRAQLDAASYIDLTRADTQQGVQALEAMGLLGEGRAVEILDGPIGAHEYYRDA